MAAVVSRADFTAYWYNRRRRHNRIADSDDFALSEYPQDLASMYWSKARVTVRGGYGPTGGATAEDVYETSATGNHTWGLDQLSNPNNRADLVNGQSYYMEAVVRPIGGRLLVMQVFNSDFSAAAVRFFDVNTGVVGAANNGYGAGFGAQALSMQERAGGFYRCRMQWTMTADALDSYFFWGSASADGTDNYAGDPTKGLTAYYSALYRVNGA